MHFSVPVRIEKSTMWRCTSVRDGEDHSVSVCSQQYVWGLSHLGTEQLLAVQFPLWAVCHVVLRGGTTFGPSGF